jgi:arginyl-tRNA synthetase
LKDIIKEKMAKKSEDKGEKVDEKAFESVTHEVSAAAMKYALLSCACQTQINFDIAKITDFEDASAPFILYNSTRLRSVIAKYESRVATGELPPLADIKEMEFDELVDDKEWALLMEYVLPFSQMLCDAALPKLPEPPALPSYGTHKVCEFLNAMVRAVSGYYGPAGVRILPMTNHVKEGEHMWNKNAMWQRVHYLTALRQVLDNGLRLLMIEPLEKM